MPGFILLYRPRRYGTTRGRRREKDESNRREGRELRFFLLSRHHHRHSHEGSPKGRSHITSHIHITAYRIPHTANPHTHIPHHHIPHISRILESGTAFRGLGLLAKGGGGAFYSYCYYSTINHFLVLISFAFVGFFSRLSNVYRLFCCFIFVFFFFFLVIAIDASAVLYLYLSWLFSHNIISISISISHRAALSPSLYFNLSFFYIKSYPPWLSW